ncbi:MAG: tetratricopeptide repeat protein [Candidatus Thorarchaeota archaeon]
MMATICDAQSQDVDYLIGAGNHVFIEEEVLAGGSIKCNLTITTRSGRGLLVLIMDSSNYSSWVANEPSIPIHNVTYMNGTQIEFEIQIDYDATWFLILYNPAVAMGAYVTGSVQWMNPETTPTPPPLPPFDLSQVSPRFMILIQEFIIWTGGLTFGFRFGKSDKKESLKQVLGTYAFFIICVVAFIPWWHRIISPWRADNVFELSDLVGVLMVSGFLTYVSAQLSMFIGIGIGDWWAKQDEKYEERGTPSESEPSQAIMYIDSKKEIRAGYWHSRGRQLFKDGKLVEARAAYQRAIDLSSNPSDLIEEYRRLFPDIS